MVPSVVTTEKIELREYYRVGRDRNKKAVPKRSTERLEFPGESGNEIASVTNKSYHTCVGGGVPNHFLARCATLRLVELIAVRGG